MSDTEKVEDQTEEETNELGAEEEISEEAIETAKEIGSILEDDDDKEDEQVEDDDKKTEGEETETKETSEKTEDDEKTKADEKDAGQEEQKDAEIDDSLLERAVSVGMTLKAARAVGSKADLESSVAFAESRKASEAKAVEKKSDAKAADEEEEEEVEVEKVNFEELLGKGYDKDLVEPLNKAFGALTDQVAQLTKDFKGVKEENAQLKSSSESRATDRALDDFDERMAKLPDDFKEVFGEGGLDDLKKDSKEYGQRSQVLAEMSALSAGYSATEQAMPPLQKLLERAVYNVTGKTVTEKQSEKAKDEKDEKVKDGLKKRADGTIGKPTGGKVKDQTNAGKAIHAANEIARLLDG